jgi:hypothetical protein
VLAPRPIWHIRNQRTDIRRKHRGCHCCLDIATREDQQPLDVVAELPDVARPVMRLKNRERVVADLSARQTRCRRNLIKKVLDKLADVLTTFRKRRHADRYDAKPVIEILPQTARSNLCFQVTARR